MCTDDEVDRKKGHQREFSKNKNQKHADLRCRKEKRAFRAEENEGITRTTVKYRGGRRAQKRTDTQWSVPKCKSVKA